MQDQRKKSETIEVRLSHEAKEAFRRKAVHQGQTLSEILRTSIADYLDGEHPPMARHRSMPAAVVAAIATLLLAEVYVTHATDHRRDYEAALASFELPTSGPTERARLMNRYGEEFAAQRLMLLNPHGMKDPKTFQLLDLNADKRLSEEEFRRLMSVPNGEPGHGLFEARDRNHDNRLSEAEFREEQDDQRDGR